jgi:hypothetical protein
MSNFGVITAAEKVFRRSQLADLFCNSLRNIVNVCIFISQTSGFYDALDDDDLLRRPEAVTDLLTCIGSALECETNNAAKIYLLNKIRTSKLLTGHLSIYFVNMMTEASNARIRSFKQPIKVFDFKLGLSLLY